MNKKESGAFLRVNRKTLYEAIRLGQVPGVARIGKSSAPVDVQMASR